MATPIPDLHLRRVIDTLHQTVLRLSEEVKTLKSTSLTRSEADALYAAAGSTSQTTTSSGYSGSLIDSQQQDLAPTVVASTDLSDGTDLAHKSTDNSFSANQTISRNIPDLVLDHTGTTPQKWTWRASQNGLSIRDESLNKRVFFIPYGKETLAIQDGITAPTVEAGWAQLYVDSADGDLKVMFGDGTVKTIVVDT